MNPQQRQKVQAINHTRLLWKTHHLTLIRDYGKVFEQVRTLKHRVFKTVKKYFEFQAEESDYTGWRYSPSYQKYRTAENNKYGFTHKDYTDCESASLYTVAMRIGQANPMITLEELRVQIVPYQSQRVQTLALLNKVWNHFTQESIHQWFKVAIRFQHTLSKYLLYHADEKEEDIQWITPQNQFDRALIRRYTHLYHRIKNHDLELKYAQQDLHQYRRYLEMANLFTGGKLETNLLQSVSSLSVQFERCVTNLHYQKLYNLLQDCLLQTCLNQIQHDESKLTFLADDGSSIIRISKIIQIMMNVQVNDDDENKQHCFPALEHRLRSGQIVRHFMHENKVEEVEDEKVMITENNSSIEIYPYRIKHLRYLLEALLTWLNENYEQILSAQ
jgi:hypothetical protein